MNVGDIDLILQLYCLINNHYDESKIQEIKDLCHKAHFYDDYLIIGRGCEYDGYDSFWVYSTLTDLLNHILKNCDLNSKIKIEDDDDVC